MPVELSCSTWIPYSNTPNSVCVVGVSAGALGKIGCGRELHFKFFALSLACACTCIWLSLHAVLHRSRNTISGKTLARKRKAVRSRSCCKVCIHSSGMPAVSAGGSAAPRGTFSARWKADNSSASSLRDSSSFLSSIGRYQLGSKAAPTDEIAISMQQSLRA